MQAVHRVGWSGGERGSRATLCVWRAHGRGGTTVGAAGWSQAPGLGRRALKHDDVFRRDHMHTLALQVFERFNLSLFVNPAIVCLQKRS